MRNIVRQTISAALAAMIITSAGIPVFADLTEQDGGIYYVKSDGSYTRGWKNVDGKRYYFKSDGTAVTKNTVIGGIMYKFGADGVCKGKFSGFVTRSGIRYYYKDGVKQSGFVTYKGNTYYFNEGTFRMARDENWIIDGYVYTFDKNGVWDGTKVSYQEYMLSQRCSIVGELVEQYNSREYEMQIKKSGKFITVSSDDFDMFLEMLSEYSDREIYYSSSSSDDELPELSIDVGSTSKDILVRFKDKRGRYFFMTFTKKAVYNNGSVINSWAFALDNSDIYDFLSSLN